MPVSTLPHFYVSDWNGTNTRTHFTIFCATDIPIHLWMRYTIIPPQIHRQTRQSGKYSGRTVSYYCFVGWQQVEQTEPGDTLTHHFTALLPDGYTPIYFYFIGEAAGITSPSTTAWSVYYPQEPGGFPYLSDKIPYCWPVVSDDDVIYAGMYKKDADQSGVWVSADNCASWERWQPTGIPANQRLVHAAQVLGGYLWVTRDPWPAALKWRIYYSLTKNGAWTEKANQGSSPLYYPDKPQLSIINAASGKHWWHGRSSFLGRNYLAWYAALVNAPLANNYNVLSGVTTAEFYLYSLNSKALWNLQGGSAFANPRYHLTSPFNQVGWVAIASAQRGSHCCSVGNVACLTSPNEYRYTTNGWASSNVRALPAALFGAGGLAPTAAVAICPTDTNIWLMVGNNITNPIMRSDDGGATWTTVKANVGPVNAPSANTIRFFTQKPTWAWCLTTTGCYLSIDKGETWTESSLNLGI